MAQEIWYDWKPTYCSKCMQIGHNCNQKQSNTGGGEMKPEQQQMKIIPKQRTEWRPINKEAGVQNQHQQVVGKDIEKQQVNNDKEAGNRDDWQQVKSKSAAKGQRTQGFGQCIQVLNGFNSLVETRQEQEARGTAECSTRRIWVIWNPNVLQYTVLEKHDQIIHGSVKILNNNKEFYFSAVYGLHNIHDRKSLWGVIRNITGQCIRPWLLMRDFNSILGAEDRMHGSEVQDNETRDFKEAIEDCSFAELPTLGRTYTWTNGHVFSRIDRAIVNDSWMINMPHHQVQIMNSMFSDHSPLGIEIEVRRDNKKRPFKFYNCMADHPEFGKIVENNWTMRNGSMEAIWRNLKSMKAALKQLNNMEFKNVKEKITTIRKELSDIQDRMRMLIPQVLCLKKKRNYYCN
ncbi:PREDICTED: uncharacterized protein LOC109209844 [Nicotiana attenuata]|uniref:uncharacterized protein LOC109209844 n=1 Tax=Nicotiana attenuata TaxID=49451 RepID=UPI000905ABA4|nr:PREDICTED: uncharacterized protein LOC109209844 [Nicotiana attenuata]